MALKALAGEWRAMASLMTLGRRSAAMVATVVVVERVALQSYACQRALAPPSTNDWQRRVSSSGRSARTAEAAAGWRSMRVEP